MVPELDAVLDATRQCSREHEEEVTLLEDLGRCDTGQRTIVMSWTIRAYSPLSSPPSHTAIDPPFMPLLIQAAS